MFISITAKMTHPSVGATCKYNYLEPYAPLKTAAIYKNAM